MKNLLLISVLSLSGVAVAHPNGTYKIDGQSEVTVTFEYLSRCPDIAGAMVGGLRSLAFSEAAESAPYEFVTGHYVETHIDGAEVYINTDDQCVPTDPSVAIPATRSTFRGYSLQKI